MGFWFCFVETEKVFKTCTGIIPRISDRKKTNSEHKLIFKVLSPQIKIPPNKAIKKSSLFNS